MKILAIVLTLFVTNAHAERLSLLAGSGVQQGSGTLGFSSEFGKGLSFKPEIGAVDDIRLGSQFVYASISGGLYLEYSNLFVRGFFGPGLISSTDSRLSTHLQFFSDAGVGVNLDGAILGVGYKHISNASIKQPNLGRDFVYVQAGFEL